MMSFSSQRAVCYLVDLVIPVLVANWLYKTQVMLKRQQFKDSKSDEIEPRGSKRQRLDLRNNEEEEGLDKFEGVNERKNIGYVPLLFVAPSQKESNRLTNMSEGTRNLNYFICIPKIG